MKQRPYLSVLRAYCIKCAMHYHYDRLVSQMQADRAGSLAELDDSLALLLPKPENGVLVRDGNT